ncbi:mitochondrial fission ELM1 family protein [Ciceribacter sp. L1K22]|uniref:mitochondrial fission ELM1 family protein n=1 Tax=Ciceribacter sp. L1K22 TaxID=2820275 RepID=UPI001ABEA9B3|nr:mitochondrial fission ELM1 family protein [Ciceribacter sp. L1K22]MBO3760967.1 mitochondrial fission ELM1 family protein [Ciceribacter sp. L1K22]
MTNGRRPTVWVLTDGKAGDEQPLIGVAEALGVTPVLRRLRPRRVFSWFMPWGPIDPREAPNQLGSPIAPPYPDICLATGRRAVSYLRRLKVLSPKTLTVFFKDPRTSRHGADLLIVQHHDRPALADNILAVTTAPNRTPLARLDTIRRTPPPHLVALPHPRIAVLVGGDSRHSRFTPDDIDAFASALESLHDRGTSLMITTSRRTPRELADRLATLGERNRVNFWTGTGENPLAGYLALADEVVVTADSTNMIGEAAGTGRPIRLFYPSGGHRKIDRFIAALSVQANIGRFPGNQVMTGYEPVNSTSLIANRILEKWQTMRQKQPW